jgi:hypothetical protein
MKNLKSKLHKVLFKALSNSLYEELVDVMPCYVLLHILDIRGIKSSKTLNNVTMRLIETSIKNEKYTTRT